MATRSSLGIYLWVAIAGAAPSSHGTTDGGSAAPGNLIDEIAGIVEKNFYSPARLEEVGWGAAVARARQEFAATDSAAERTAILRKLVASLKTSHTTYYPRADPGYWFWASLFEQMLQRVCPKEQTPGFPVARDDIGVFWKQVEDGWFVGGVFVGGPADRAGLRLGDRILAADGQPFSPVDSFAGRAGKPVSLQVQRARGAAPISVVVTPQSTRPQEELRQATADSWRIIEHKGRRVAYIHMWSWASIEFQKVLLDAIAKSNTEGVDGFVLDVRDGWGGASGNYLGIFWRDVPLLESVDRDGQNAAIRSTNPQAGGVTGKRRYAQRQGDDRVRGEEAPHGSARRRAHGGRVRRRGTFLSQRRLASRRRDVRREGRR